ncbi:nuclear hormone receptor HR96 isoform X2 [Lingula anatina]|uniref:Nuclear hormone receptor HR96 isoform X2 n=1 Tax=Lingula anatina TaxID=7574 RepID=A0A1S3I4X2_LINAN|nr:nuclear hormone receptor HR96 isoform X2 [Lingula anatina]|eukprot:XP_013392881.1 nuclear hormone receptor HR96 isoform X2 [Lingula anatina]
MAESTFDDLPCSSIPTPPSSETESMMNMSASSPDDVRPQRVGSKRKIKNKEDKVCGVCGDSALGYNFDAITCESCKAFFRRNAFKEKGMSCMFHGKCVVDVATRRFCSHCRLKKCFAAGMKKDMILDEVEKKKRIEKVQQNREKRKSTKTIHEAIIHEEESASCDGLPCSDVQAHFLLDPTLPPEDATPTTRRLTDEELLLITSLQNLYSATLGYVVDEAVSQRNSLSNLVNMTGNIVRKLIKFAKKLQDFMSLSQDLQIVLLKGATMNCILLRSAAYYDVDKDAWITPHGEIPTLILKNVTSHTMMPLYEDHLYICRRLKEAAGNDVNLFVLLHVLSVFSPEYANVARRALISNIQDRYCVLMKHYIEATYSYSQAVSLYPTLLQRLSEIKQYSEKHGKILLHVNTSEIEPILLEIFDLK